MRELTYPYEDENGIKPTLPKMTQERLQNGRIALTESIARSNPKYCSPTPSKPSVEKKVKTYLELLIKNMK